MQGCCVAMVWATVSLAHETPARAAADQPRWRRRFAARARDAQGRQELSGVDRDRDPFERRLHRGPPAQGQEDVPGHAVVRPQSHRQFRAARRALKHQELRKLEKYKNRALVEGRQMEDLVVTPAKHDGVPTWEYEGQLFSLESTADEPMTPAADRAAGANLHRLSAALCRRAGSPRVASAFVFSAPPINTAQRHEGRWPGDQKPGRVPGRSEHDPGRQRLNRFDAELAQINRHHLEIKQQLDTLIAELPARLRNWARRSRKTTCRLASGKRSSPPNSASGKTNARTRGADRRARSQERGPL